MISNGHRGWACTRASSRSGMGPGLVLVSVVNTLRNLILDIGTGWRFAVWEMSSLLIDLLSNFEFKMPNDSRGIQRIASLGMLPGIKGDRAAGSQLPLDVTIIRD